MKFFAKISLLGFYFAGCSAAEFSGPSGGGPVKSSPKSTKNPQSSEVPASSKTGDNSPVASTDSSIEVSRQCILQVADAINVKSVSISGENCYPNQIDANGADKDDYLVQISGDFLRSGWQIFSNKDQDIAIHYSLGSPGTTTQTVSLQVIDCNKVKQKNFDVSTGTGTGTTQLTAKRGDRFNIVSSVTSGCYGRNDVYDMLELREKAFLIK